MKIFEIIGNIFLDIFKGMGYILAGMTDILSKVPEYIKKKEKEHSARMSDRLANDLLSASNKIINEIAEKEKLALRQLKKEMEPKIKPKSEYSWHGNDNSKIRVTSARNKGPQTLDDMMKRLKNGVVTQEDLHYLVQSKKITAEEADNVIRGDG